MRMATEAEQQDAPQEEHPFRYPEFAGWSGERYLKKLLRQILPMALYRTWEICAEHQARGQDCYVGVAQLASLAGRTVRTLQKNLAELGAKQLLVERAERKVVRRRDGTHAPRMVVVKDFSPLYALAHEYHEWLGSPDYIAPERALCAVLAQDRALVAQVRRYNNYRRVLYTDRPGPLPREREEERWFTDYRCEVTSIPDTVSAVPSPHREPPVPRSLANKVAQQREKDSPQRIQKRTKKTEKYQSDSGDSVSSLQKKDGVREKGHQQPSEQEPSAVAEHHPLKRGQTAAPQAGRSRPLPAPAQESALPQREPVTANPQERGEPGQQQPVQQAPVTSQRNQDDRAAGSWRNQKPRSPQTMPTSPVQVLARSFVQAIAGPFGDANLPGSITRVLRVLSEVHLEHPTEVLQCLVRAYTVARETRSIRPAYQDPSTGRANRMPLFCAMFQRFAHGQRQARSCSQGWQEVETELATDEHLPAWWNQQQAWRAVCKGEDCPQDAQAEEGEQEEQEASVLAPEANRTMQSVRERAPATPRRTRCSQSEQEREQRATVARQVVGCLRAMGVVIHNPIIWHEHVVCGCPLYHRQAGHDVCARCSPDPGWPGQVHALIRSIVQPRAARTLSPWAREVERLAGDQEPARQDQDASSQCGWSTREEACAWGVHVLEQLVADGYPVEVRGRVAGEWYQVVGVDEEGELVLQTPEQVAFVLERAHMGACVAPARPREKAASG